MKDLLKNLKSEHEFILNEMRILAEALSINQKRLHDLFQFVEFTHHEKEENILFPWIARQNWLRHGGPLCGHFMGIRLDLNPLARINQHLDDFNRMSLAKKDSILLPPDKKFAWLSPQSPLSIPMEEHEVGHRLSEALRHLMQISAEASQEAIFRTLLQDYFSLLKMHIHKEDHCLFVQCEQSLF
ncbi:MAG TPA: hypothetical protein VIG33_00040 [Pseudobdellovibrionaceae bacterium]|jgi:hemerythrin-like domain-containing protein